MAQMGNTKREVGPGAMGMETIPLAPAWSGKGVGLRTDSCLGAGAEEFGGQWVCGNSIRKQGVSRRCSWYDSGPPQ